MVKQCFENEKNFNKTKKVSVQLQLPKTGRKNKKKMTKFLSLQKKYYQDYLLLHKKVLLKDLTHLLEMVQFYLLMVDVHITQKQKVWLL